MSAQVRLEVERAPDPPDRRLRQPAALGHRRPRPVRRVPRLCSSVATTTSSTLSSRIDGGRPGRGSSTRPSSRSREEPRRHLPTVVRRHPQIAATCLLVAPGSAHASTIRARNASACADFARRAHRVSCSRSASVSTSSAFGRPVRAWSSSPARPPRRTVAATCAPSSASTPSRARPAPPPPRLGARQHDPRPHCHPRQDSTDTPVSRAVAQHWSAQSRPRTDLDATYPTG